MLGRQSIIATCRLAARRIQARSFANAVARSEQQDARRMFDQFDTKGDKTLCAADLQEGLESVGAALKPGQLENLVSSDCKSKDGNINFDKFYSILVEENLLGKTAALTKKDLCAVKTDEWVQAVTGYNSAHIVASIFADDAVLLGTVSRTIRTKTETGDLGIKEYFDYFAKLPDIQVVRREDNIVRVTDEVFVNNAMVFWSWSDGPTVEDPLCARMTFVYRYSPEMGDVELFQLHSSALPAPKID